MGQSKQRKTVPPLHGPAQLRENPRWDDAVGIVGLVGVGIGGIFVALENYPLAELCFGLSGLALAVCSIVLKRHWMMKSVAFLAGLGLIFLVHSTDEYRIKKEADAFQQNLQSQQAQHLQSSLEDFKKLLLENTGKAVSTPDLNKFIDDRGFEKKYPLGFSLFYADGSKTLHYGRLPNPDVSFDPSSIKAMSITTDVIHATGFEITVKKGSIKLDDFYISNEALKAKHLMRINGVNVDAESLGISTEGAAWIIGVRPAE